MSCPHESVEYDEDAKTSVCKDCGLVLSQSELVDASTIQPSGVKLEPSENPFWEQFKLIDALCQRFSLSVSQAAKQFFMQLRQHDRLLVSMGKKGHLAAAISVLQANRLSSSPAALSLADLASSIDEPLPTLGNYYYQAKKRAPKIFSEGSSSRNDVQLLIERLLMDPVRPWLDRNGIIIEDYRRLQSLAFSLAGIVSISWLYVGRKPEPFALACIFFALDTIFAGIPRRKTPFGRAQKMSICDLADIKWRTVELRIDELVKFLVIEGQKIMPITLSKQNVFSHADDIARLLAATGTTGGAPPAYEASQKQTEAMRALVILARKRLVGEKAEEEISETDLIIERLLLKGAKEEEIVACKNDGQLYSLLSLYEPLAEDEEGIDSVQ